MSDQAKRPAGITPSATVGPYFAYGLTPGKDYPFREMFGPRVEAPDSSGERIRIEGRVIDGDGEGIPDSVVEIWQADASGHYAHPRDPGRSNTGFRGFARCGTNKTGGYGFDTIKPGSVAGAKGAKQAPHLLVAVFARGMLRHLYTRIYFDDEAGNASDGVLALVPAERRKTLIARKDGPVYRFDIRLQGGDETVFFDI
jgi:protocatechuate 3,4-dioxygenase alpha subunit